MGGQSTRFGRDKASFAVAGRPMALHVAAALDAWLETVTLVGDCRARFNPGLPTIPDSIPDSGPLGGIVAALEHSRRPWSVIAACDMPLVSSDQVANLLQAAAASEAQAVIPRTPDGRLQPLFAAYHRSARAPLASALAEGRLKLARALDAVRWTELAVTDGTGFTNVNTQADVPLLP